MRESKVFVGGVEAHDRRRRIWREVEWKTPRECTVNGTLRCGETLKQAGGAVVRMAAGAAGDTDAFDGGGERGKVASVSHSRAENGGRTV